MTVIERLEPQAQEGASEDEIKEMEALLDYAPPKVLNIDAHNTFTLGAAMLFKDCIFKTKIEVTSNGFIRITEHELAVGGLTPESGEQNADGA